MKYTLSKGLNNSPDARAIRQSVFVEEQGFEYEFDDIDEIALHLVLYDENDNRPYRRYERVQRSVARQRSYCHT